MEEDFGQSHSHSVPKGPGAVERGWAQEGELGLAGSDFRSKLAAEDSAGPAGR